MKALNISNFTKPPNSNGMLSSQPLAEEDLSNGIEDVEPKLALII